MHWLTEVISDSPKPYFKLIKIYKQRRIHQSQRKNIYVKRRPIIPRRAEFCWNCRKCEKWAYRDYSWGLRYWNQVKWSAKTFQIIWISWEYLVIKHKRHRSRTTHLPNDHKAIRRRHHLQIKMECRHFFHLIAPIGWSLEYFSAHLKI